LEPTSYRTRSYPNLLDVPESETIGMTVRAAVLAAAGREILSLAAGEPDFVTPDYIREAAIRAIREGRTHYPPPAGLAELRAAIAAHVSVECGGDWSPSQILVSAGAKQSLFNAIFTLFGTGDRVVVPAPYWVSYPAMLRLARAEPVVVETSAMDGFKLAPDALERAFAGGARGVILNSPSNPTGAIYTESELAALLEVADRHGAWVVADEIYREIRYVPGGFPSVARAGYERAVVVDGFSKAYAMTGWRVGWAAAPEFLVRAMTRLQGHVNTNTSLPSQYAALAALVEEPARRAAVTTMVTAFRRRRALVLEGLSGVMGLSPVAPDGAFYVWIDVSAWCEALGADSATLALDLLEREGVALVPGGAFGGEGYLRLSFAARDEVLAAAVERLRAAATRLGVAA
jgi:aspartate aminotransferase